jgi:hypothetical protein
MDSNDPKAGTKLLPTGSEPVLSPPPKKGGKTSSLWLQVLFICYNYFFISSGLWNSPLLKRSVISDENDWGDNDSSSAKTSPAISDNTPPKEEKKRYSLCCLAAL